MSPPSAAPGPVPPGGGDPLVVVVAFHAPDLLDRCLAELGDGFDVVVVDNSSDDRVAGRRPTPRRPLRRPGSQPRLRRRRQPRDHRAGWAATSCCSTPTPPSLPPGARALHAALRRRPGPGRRGPAPVMTPGTGRTARVAWPFPTPGGAWLQAVGLGRVRRRDDFLIGSVLLLRGAALDDVGGVRRPVLPLCGRDRLAASGRRPRLAGGTLRGVMATHVGAGTGGDPVDPRDPFPGLPRAVRPEAPRHSRTGGRTGRRAWPAPRRGPSSSRGARRRRGRPAPPALPHRAAAGRGGARTGPACASSTSSSPTPSPVSSATSARWPTGWPPGATGSRSSAGLRTGCWPSSTTP